MNGKWIGTTSPLMLACGSGKPTSSSAEMTKVLIEAGASVNRRHLLRTDTKKDPGRYYRGLHWLHEKGLTVLGRLCRTSTVSGCISHKTWGRNWSIAEDTTELQKPAMEVMRILLEHGAKTDAEDIREIFGHCLPKRDFTYCYELLEMLIRYGAVDPKEILDGPIRLYGRTAKTSTMIYRKQQIDTIKQFVLLSCLLLRTLPSIPNWSRLDEILESWKKTFEETRNLIQYRDRADIGEVVSSFFKWLKKEIAKSPDDRNLDLNPEELENLCSGFQRRQEIESG